MVVVVTGAGSGLGRALAVSLTAAGEQVVLVGRRPAALIESRDLCVAAGARSEDVAVLAVDITMADTAQNVVAETADRFGRLDGLVNNAAVMSVGPLSSTTGVDFRQMLDTHVVAPLDLVRCAAPMLREANGAVVNIGSVGGVLALRDRAMYGASKAALHHLTRSLARELAPDVRVNAVVPGGLDTDMADSLDMAPAERNSLRRQVVASTPLGRLGTPGDIVPWIELLLGPAGRWITGSLFVLDGGRSC